MTRTCFATKYDILWASLLFVLDVTTREQAIAFGKYLHRSCRVLENAPPHPDKGVIGPRQPAGQGLILAALGLPNGQQQDSGHFPQ